jgi:hypothetical protein
MSCANNIRQIAMACINHESARKQLPGSVGNYNPSTSQLGVVDPQPNPLNPLGATVQVSWMTNLLPYIEQEILYRNVDITREVTNHAPSAATAKQRINLYRCPSDTTPTTLPNRAQRAGEYAVTSYKGVAGSNWAWGVHNTLPNSDPDNLNFFNSDPFFKNNGNGIGNGNGIFFAGYVGPDPVTSTNFGVPCNTLIAAVKDGLSNTLMVGESVGSYTSHNWWYWFNGSVATVAIPLNAPPVCSQSAGVPLRKGYENCFQDWQNNYGFTSDHAVGANFAAADGSVRFISNTVDQKPYRALGGMAEGYTAAMPD